MKFYIDGTSDMRDIGKYGYHGLSYEERIKAQHNHEHIRQCNHANKIDCIVCKK